MKKIGAFIGLSAGSFTGLFLSLILLGLPAHAAKFANQFIEFELPAQWQCNLEGAEWVCQSLNDQNKRDAIIVLAAKLKGDQDSLDQYLAYLKNSKVYTSIKGQTVKSDPKYAKNIQIGDQPWVDSLHLQSEIPGFYTRYIATVKNDIGVLVTYSINKDKYQAYQSQFENMVQTLKVFRKPGGINTGPQGNIFNPAPNVQEATVFGQPIAGGAQEAPKGAPKQQELPLQYILAGVVAVAFIIWKRRKS